MSRVETLLHSFFEKRNVTSFSCTIPYDNFSYFGSLELFGRLVVILSPENQYVQRTSLLSLNSISNLEVETVFPLEVLSKNAQTPGETQLYVLLPPFPKGAGCPVTACLLHLLVLRLKRNSCRLVAETKITQLLLQKITQLSGESFKSSDPVTRNNDIQITEIYSTYRPKESSSSAYWVDEDGEEIEEEL